MTKEMTTAQSLPPAKRIKNVVSESSVMEQFKNALDRGSDLFVASLIDLYINDPHLQKCPANLVVAEALKAATLKLPINRNLGFAWIVPYWNSKQNCYIPNFQPGWRGIIQLALRTGKYININCGEVYEGELKGFNKLTGDLDISGTATSEKVVGYFAYFKMTGGFSKTSYWSKEKMQKHVMRYNPECRKAKKIVGVWADHFDARAMVTVLKHLLKNYGEMSVEMISVMGETDQDHGSGNLNDDINGMVDLNAGADGAYEMNEPPEAPPAKKAPGKKAPGKKAPDKKESPDITCSDSSCDNNMMGECAAGFCFDDDKCKAYKAGPGFGK